MSHWWLALAQASANNQRFCSRDNVAVRSR
jgi:hypothetical protein